MYCIETKALTKRYANQVSVDNLNLHVPKGKIYGLLGQNGAGKSTTMKLLLNLVKPTSGEIWLFGQNTKEMQLEDYYKIGAMIETPSFYENLTAKENLTLLSKLRKMSKRKERIEEVLSIVHLEQETHKIFRNYSLGMKQRLGLAAALLYEPELLILDEPINGLDPIGISEMRRYLIALCQEKGITILLSSHILSEIEQMADIIGVMHHAKLIQEIDMKTLHEQNEKSIMLTISESDKAIQLLETYFPNLKYIRINENTLKVIGAIEKRGDILTCLIKNHLIVEEMRVQEEKLEDYFKNLIGGDAYDTLQ